MSTADDEWDGYDDDQEEPCPFCNEIGCTSAECEAEANCGEYPRHLGGGCALAGTEQCDFDCPNHDRVFKIRRQT